MKKKHSRMISMLLVILLLAGSPVVRGTVRADVQDKTVRVGYFTMENFMEGGTDGSPLSGFTYELLCEIAVYNHWNIEYVHGDFSELYGLLTEGGIDILPNVIDTEKRKEQVLFHPFAINEEHYYVSTLTGSYGHDETVPADLNGKKLATVKDAYEELYFDDWAINNGVTVEKIYCDGFDEAWEVVRAGKADFILNINNTAPDPGFTTLFEVGSHDVHFALACDREDLARDINYALKMIDDISPFLISNLKQKYLNEALSSYQLSTEEKSWVDNHSELRIGGLKDDVPYAYEDENGKVIGTYVELTDMILEKLALDSVQVKWTLYPSMDEMRAAVLDGSLDLICPEYHSYYEAEKNGFAISETIVNIPMGLLTLNATDINEVKTIATGGTRPGLIYVRDTFPEAEIITGRTVNELVTSVEKGEADAAIAHIYALQDSIRDRRTGFSVLPLSEPCIICYAAPEEHHELIMMMNRGYHLIDQAERNAIELTLVGSSNAETINEFLRKNIAYILLIALFVVAIIAYAVLRTVSSRKLKKDLDEITRQKDIIEAAQHELEIARDEAQTANRAKSAFLFNMSHDIRTPMNAVIGFTNMAKDHVNDPEKVSDCLEKIDTSSKHLLKLINNVLDMARIESGKNECENKEVRLSGIAEDTMNMVRDTASKDLTFSTDFSGIVHDWVQTDELRLTRIFSNILSNSVNFTNEGGAVSFVIRETRTDTAKRFAYEFIISDTGIGMSDEFLPHLFEEFSREESTTKSGVAGNGLGMAITKNLVEILGGTIEVESRSGEGTTVTVRIEMDAVVPSPMNRGSTLPFNPPALDGMKILLVEDNEMNREIAVDILEERGVKVDTAEDGDIAVEKMRNAKPGQYDLILMDIQMPRMNGYEATREIRKLPEAYASCIPIIAMTANAFDEDKRNAFEAGMNAHLAKPIDIEKLLSTLSRVIY